MKKKTKGYFFGGLIRGAAQSQGSGGTRQGNEFNRTVREKDKFPPEPATQPDYSSQP